MDEPTHDKCFFCQCEARLTSVFSYLHGWIEICKHCYMSMVVSEPKEAKSCPK